MFTKIILLAIHLLFFIILSSAESYSQNVMFEKSVSKYAVGDNLEWSSDDYNNDNWKVIYTTHIPYESNKLWIKTKFYSNASDIIYSDLRITIYITATYEIYWNGNYIGTNCISGSDINLRNGQFSKIFDLSNSEILKENILALRVLVSDGEEIELADMLIESKDSALEGEFYKYGYLSVLFILHLIFLIFFITNPLNFSKFQVFYFSVLLITILFTLIYEVLLFLGIISYHHDLIIKTIEFYQNNFLLLGITIFYFIEFNIKNSILYIGVTAIVIVILNYLNASDAYLYFAGLFPSISFMICATIKKKVAALYSLIFLLIIFSILYAWYIFSLVDISFLIFPTFFIIRKIRLDAKKTKKMHKTELRAVRLETEMLKKILQPHYVMNSLNSVLEWIEESPRQGLKFIKELSDEFRSFLTFSNRKFVTVKDEIGICKNHLKIMGYRQHKNFTLVTNIKSLNKSIPPAIFHTLVENGITHNLTHSDSICFFIDEQTLQNGTRFRISVNYNGDCSELNLEEELKIKNDLKHSLDITEGNGIKYIRSRLTESYGDNWNLFFFGNEQIWITDIEIYNEKS